MSDMTVANTILSQLGGRRFLVMTGANNLFGDDRSLTFKLPARFAKDGISGVKVTLNRKDLYDVRYLKIAGKKVVDVATTEDLYAEDLRKDFTRKTGLETSL